MENENVSVKGFLNEDNYIILFLSNFFLKFIIKKPIIITEAVNILRKYEKDFPMLYTKSIDTINTSGLDLVIVNEIKRIEKGFSC